ncbi:MAG: LacI family DNA-binding transcriptional regulator [Fimbriimonas sp.]
MRTRLKDVAESLNLSPALISGVLNGRSNVWASEETRARIFEAARALNYRASTAAQALSLGKTNRVALVYRRLEGLGYRLAYTGLVDAFSAELQARGHDLVVSNFATQEEVLDHLRNLANSRGCDAVILWGREADTEPQGELLESLGVPFLVKGRHEERHPCWYQLDFDHEWMTATAVERVVGRGHRRLAYLGFPHDDAFVHALRRGYVAGHERLLGSTPDPAFFGEFEDDVEANERKISEWLALPEDVRPTGFVIGSGNFAWHALETCLAQIGGTLGFGAGNFAAAGVASYSFTLMFGHADAYQGIEIDNLARVASPKLLNAVLGGEEADCVNRFRPKLTEAPSLDLLKHGVTFVNPSRSEVAP